MLRQGAPVREFADPDALRAHYRRLRARLWAPRAVVPSSEAVEAQARAEAHRVRELHEAEARRQAELAAIAEMDALVHQVLPPEKLALEPKRIIADVAEAFGITADDIIGPSRRSLFVRARLAAIAAVHAAHPDWSLNRLGRSFNRDHSTVHWALAKVARDGIPQPPAGDVS